MYDERGHIKPGGVLLWCVAGFVALVLVVGVSIGGCTGVNAWKRGQKRANAHNKVSITHIEIQNARQQAQVVQANNARVTAQAQQRYLEAVGIRRAQDEISKTLTPLYIQHEAIQAQEAEASKPNSTMIYVPVGNQGVPLVNTIPQGGK